jgi:TPR repeat protein
MNLFALHPISMLMLFLAASLSALAQQSSPEIALTGPAAEVSAQGLYVIGITHFIGEVVPKDAVEAAKWFRRAAELGNADAQVQLGLMYGGGYGVPNDDVEASKWFRKAAEQGHVRGQLGLGAGYQKGRGVPKDEAEAAKWYRKAAEQGNAEAQLRMGLAFNFGAGVSQDEAQAYQWFLLAGAQGHEVAKECYTELETNLTPEMRTEGQRLAREFKPKVTDKQ